MNAFVNAVKTDINEEMTTTTNGMAARVTTANAVLDLFGKIGSSRGTPLAREFSAALAENEELALRTLLWARDIRGGAGERGQFRALLSELEAVYPTLAGKLMHKVPELGRWDDLFVYSDPINRKNALELFATALRAGNGLAFKWAPREKSAKSKEAKELRQTLGMNAKQYRKFVVNGTKVVEQLMCAKEWDAINFSHVPSLASARYQKAFGRNAQEAYAKYLAELQKPQAERDPKVKINAGAVYPHDVVKSVAKGNAGVANEQWNALPNYVGDAKTLPIVDVSGSMGSLRGYGFHNSANGPQPIEVAVALGLYLSEKNTGDFRDVFMTFSGSPKFVNLKGSLSQRIDQMQRADWGYNTNVEAAFELLLKTATANRVPHSDMPETLLILSDMQFDQAQGHGGWYNRNQSVWNDTAVQMIRKKFAEAGYAMPKLVFWNLNAQNGRDNTPVRFDETGTALVSGFSPSIMKSVLSNDLEDYTPLNVMLQTIMNDRYAY